MDRRTILERLDAVRPGVEDFDAPELAGVGDILSRDPALAAEFRCRQEWDRRIGEAVRDVPVPPGLKSRLLAAVAEAPVVPAPEPSPRTNRRRWLTLAAGVVATAAAAAILVAVGGGSAETVTIAEVRDAATAQLRDRGPAVPFQGDFKAVPPVAFEARLRLAPRPLGLLPTEGGRHRAAAFAFRGRGPRPIEGLLVVLPVSAVAADALPKSDSADDRDYRGRVDGVETVAWTEGDFVYVCSVKGRVDDLLRQLDGVAV